MVSNIDTRKIGGKGNEIFRKISKELAEVIVKFFQRQFVRAYLKSAAGIISL